MLDSQTPDKLNWELRSAILDAMSRVYGYDSYSDLCDDDEDTQAWHVATSITRQADKAVSAITTAYAEAGYKTGEEWLERFVSELGFQFERSDLIGISMQATWVYEAAKRASGLLPNGKDE